MLARDFAALLAALFAIYLVLQNEGDIGFVRSWYYPLDEPPFQMTEAYSPLPRPLVVDLNGDGRPEVILATDLNELLVVGAKPSIRVPDGFSRAQVMANITLVEEVNEFEQRSSEAAALRKMRVVALSAGYLDPIPTELVRARRKQVVVVLTQGRELICLDHNLKVMWRQRHIMGWFPDEFQFREVSVVISNHTMREGDRGVIIVAASVTKSDQDLKEALEFERELAGDEVDEKKADEGATEEAKKKDDAFNYWDVDSLRHVNYYAFDGATGFYRWSHVGSDLRHNAEEEKELLIPQHNYRLEANAITQLHAGETNCREYKESLLYTSFPHTWRQRSDTRLELAHFVKQKESKGKDMNHIASSARQLGVLKGGGQDANRHHFAGRDRNNPVTKTIGAVTSKASGAADTQRGAMPPNVIVAHIREGIEVVHLYTGRVLCRIALQPGLLHADLNGDGVVDHIVTRGGNPGVGVARGGAKGRGRADSNCYVSVTSGIGHHDNVFNGSLCRERIGSGMASLESLFGSRYPGNRKGPIDLEVAPPLLVPMHASRRKTKSRMPRGRAWMSVFLNSRGEVITYDPHGTVAWSIETDASWMNPKKVRPGDRVIPTLELFPLRTRSAHRVVVAAGSHTATFLTTSGEHITDVSLPSPPARPLIYADLNGNGLTDILLVTHDGVYGYNQVHHVGSGPLQGLVVCLVVAMAATYLTAVVPGGKRKRSTERTD